MSTSRSSRSKLKREASQIAQKLKAMERGEVPEMAATRRDKESVKFGVVMDDKVFTIEMTWAKIIESSEVALTEFILKQMRQSRETEH